MLATVRPLLFAVVAVVASFVFALWLSQHRLNDVEANVYEVAANAEPSVVHLEDARTELGRIGLYVDEYVAALADHLPTAHASSVRVNEAHTRLRAILAAYERLPFFPGEEDMYRDAKATLGIVDQAVRTVLDKVDAGELDPATVELFDVLHPEMDHLDAKLEAIVGHDTRYAVTKLEDIAASRRRSWRTAMLGGSLSLVLSALATVVATSSLWKAALARRELDRERGARLEGERQIRRRDEFLSLVSHELRTPLAALQLAVEGVTRKSGRVSPSLQATALRQVGRMSALVEDLVLVAQLDLGTFAIRREAVDLVGLVRDCMGALASMIAQSSSNVSLRAGVSIVGQWDVTALRRVIDKLLANALRFGMGRPIDVEVSQKDGTACVVVHDRGIGIPPHRITAIFERFERGVPERSYPGLGIGLYIARSLVQAMGGTIAAASRPSEGTWFTVELPLTAPGTRPR